MAIVITVKINKLANHMLASMNYITKTNLLQHLKVIQRSKALASIHVLSSFYEIHHRLWHCRTSKESTSTIQYKCRSPQEKSDTGYYTLIQHRRLLCHLPGI